MCLLLVVGRASAADLAIVEGHLVKDVSTTCL